MKHLVTCILLTFVLAYSTKGSVNHDFPESSSLVSLNSYERAGDHLADKEQQIFLRVVHHRHSILPYRHVHTTQAMLTRVDARLTPATVKDKNDLANSSSYYHSINLRLLFPYHYFW
jgi:hypothetical protein